MAPPPKVRAAGLRRVEGESTSTSPYGMHSTCESVLLNAPRNMLPALRLRGPPSASLEKSERSEPGDADGGPAVGGCEKA